LEVEPAVSLRGDIAVPGDKSISHRALLLGAIADGESRFTGFVTSRRHPRDGAAMRALGAEVDLDGDGVRVGGLACAGCAHPARRSTAAMRGR
jgi:3-phosphoshikimate 1-carboxyvinyltransferase